MSNALPRQELVKFFILAVDMPGMFLMDVAHPFA